MTTTRRADQPPESNEGRSGQSLVELAIAFPLLLMTLLGTIDVGRLFFDYVDLRHAATEGATYGSRHPTDQTGIGLTVTHSGVPAGTLVTVQRSGTCDAVNGQGTITVVAESEFTPVTASFFARFGLESIQLRASTTMRCLT